MDGIRILGFHARKGPIIGALLPERTSKEQAKYPPMPKLVLYGIAKQFLGTVLDIEVEHSVT